MEREILCISLPPAKTLYPLAGMVAVSSYLKSAGFIVDELELLGEDNCIEFHPILSDCKRRKCAEFGWICDRCPDICQLFDTEKGAEISAPQVQVLIMKI